MSNLHEIPISVFGQPEAGQPRTFVTLSQDENGRLLRFKVIGGVTIPEGATAALVGTKPDGKVYSTTGTIDGNNVIIQEDIQMTAVAGTWDAKLDIVSGTNNIMSSIIRFLIVRNTVTAGSIPSDSQLDGIVAECKSYAEAAKNEAYGSPLTASTAAGMTDKQRVYVYTGSETGYTSGHWYYWDGNAWADGGVYNAVAIDTDTTLSVSGKAADAKETGDQITELKSGFSDIQSEMGVLRSYEQTLIKLNGYFINSSGVISTIGNNGYKVTDYIDVDGYYQAIVTGSAGTNLLLCAFYDSNHDFISGVQGTVSAVTDQTILIPSGAKYLVIANDSRNTSACTLTKWSYPYIQDFQTGYREYTTVWKNSNIDSSGAGIYNQHPAITNSYLATSDYDFVFRDSTITEGHIYYYDYDADSQTYTFVKLQAITPNIAHVIDKTYSHFRLRLFENWSSVVDVATAQNSFKLYKYVSVAHPPIWFGKKWAAIGDSLTEINRTATAKYHDLISQQTGITVVNLGDGGTGYKSTDGGAGDSFMDRVANVPLDSDVITIFGSGNDLGSENEIGTPTDTGTTTLCGCINMTIDNLITRMPLANIGIVTPTPWKQYNPSNDQNKMALYADAIVTICKNRGIPCLDLYHCSGFRPWDSTFKTLAYANADGVHPNNVGHALIAPKFQAFLDALLLH